MSTLQLQLSSLAA
jgi:hypothetical protein